MKMTIETGKFQRTEEMTENTAYGKSTYRHIQQIIIKEEVFNGKPPRMYQTERTYRNNVMTYTANYPADTEYAKERREWVCNF
jgi:hypothetical protein